jgi:anti-sigma regulatory factor (Ser/Thr protein kinase)
MHLVLPPDHSAARTARRAITDQLRGVVAREVLEAIVLVASELVSNAVIHARTTCALDLSLTDDLVRISVTDGSVRLPVRQAPSATGGRGLVVVEAIARSWDVESTRHGKTVWAEVLR